MAKHDELLSSWLGAAAAKLPSPGRESWSPSATRGPREAPEPETAEEKSRKLGLKSAGGVVAGGGVVAAKAGAIGGLGKFFLWLFLWNGVSSAARIGGWIGIAVLLALAAGFIWWRRQRTA